MRRLCDRCQLPISWLRRRGPALQVAQSAHRHVNLKRRVTCDRDSRIRLPRSAVVHGTPGALGSADTCSKRKPFGSVLLLRLLLLVASSDRMNTMAVVAHAHATRGGVPDASLLLPAGRVLAGPGLTQSRRWSTRTRASPTGRAVCRALILLRSMQLARSPAAAKSHVRASGRAII